MSSPQDNLSWVPLLTAVAIVVTIVVAIATRGAALGAALRTDVRVAERSVAGPLQAGKHVDHRPVGMSMNSCWRSNRSSR